MALKQATKDALKKWGINADDLVKAANETDEKDFAFEIKDDLVKTNFPDHSFLSTDDLNGLKGRVKNETLQQATELGIKAIKDKAGLTFEGKDPDKFLEELGKHLKLPVDDKIREKDRDIATLQRTLSEEKEKYTNLEKTYKDRQDLDNFAKLLPANKTKILRDSEIRSRYGEEGYTLGEYDDNGAKKPAVFKNGEVMKDKELKLIDPKAHLGEWMKTNGLIDTAGSGKPPRQSFDTEPGKGGTTGDFDSAGAYKKALDANGGKWNERAQAMYTEAMVGAK